MPWVRKESRTMKRLPLGFLPGSAIQAITRFGPSWALRAFDRADKSLSMERPAFVLRVDDYPRWDVDSSEFQSFDDVFRALEVPYVLGITPWCEFHKGSRHWIDAREVDYLRDLTSRGRVELALHGFTHIPRFVRGYITEVGALTQEALQRWINLSEDWFEKMRLPAASAFIPPFNSLRWEHFAVLRESFGVIMTGPSALSSLGPYKAQMWEGTIYLPSYRPLVGLASEILKKLKVALSLPQLHAITIHWAWERETGFRGVRDLVKRVKAMAEVWTLSRTVAHFSANKPSRRERAPNLPERAQPDT